MIVRKNKYGFKILKEVWYLFLNGYINTIQSIIIKASKKTYWRTSTLKKKKNTLKLLFKI